MVSEEEFKKKFPSIKYIHRVSIDTGAFKADDNVISKADVYNHCQDNKIILEAIENAKKNFLKNNDWERLMKEELELTKTD